MITSHIYITMNSLSISSKPFITKLQENLQRVDKRVNDYIADSNEENIHNIRTSIRRADASFRSLPKKVRKRNKVSNYLKLCKQLFKINSKIRDYDIIYEKLRNYSSQPIYTELTELLKTRRDAELRKGRDTALSLRKIKPPKIYDKDISKEKLNRRFNKIISRSSDKIELNFPIVLTNADRTIQLHEMRKDCKKLRYLLELLSYQNNKEVERTITELEKIQEMLGSIHDDDIMITYLRRSRNSKEIRHILDDVIAERARRYNEFIGFCKDNLSNSKENFFSQIWALT
ncbi:MAG TPA: CHAD domain-containing protein [Nitrososphaeraceae archaeon]|jgi:CHAD domain-containing protein|nr:CHAD domain-containing protein [Nitrososphaeraceae archaeon]